MSAGPTPVVERPSWRGWIHFAALVAAVPAGVLLIVSASRPAAVTAASIYIGSMIVVFATSFTYHRLTRTERAQRIMQRLDHSMIYLLIAGSYTPICLLGLPRGWGITLLSIVGGGALVGMLLKLAAFGRANWLGYSLYPVLGWLLVIATPVLAERMSPATIALLFAGGLLYTVGFPVLMLERPDPWPKTFGYHEIWHTMTVGAAGCHFAAIALLVR